MAKKFIDANKFDLAKSHLEKALRAHPHDDPVIYF